VDEEGVSENVESMLSQHRALALLDNDNDNHKLQSANVRANFKRKGVIIMRDDEKKSTNSWFDPKKLSLILKKTFSLGSQPTENTFPELLDVLVWLRFLIAICCGAWIGLGGKTGFIYVIQSLNFITFIPVMYCRFFLNTPSEAYGGSTKILFSGTANALGFFVLIWIYFFTLQHEAEEAKLTALLVVQEEITNTPLSPINEGGEL
jgi:protein-S-isoprenylcysteine O-methyltransferase Ste14